MAGTLRVLYYFNVQVKSISFYQKVTLGPIGAFWWLTLFHCILGPKVLKQQLRSFTIINQVIYGVQVILALVEPLL